MKISFDIECKLILDYIERKNRANHLMTELTLNISDNLDRTMYFDKDGYPTKEGAQCVTNVLVQGLLLNIHKLHNDGLRDSAEHLRWIISELERGFIQVTETYNG